MTHPLSRHSPEQPFDHANHIGPADRAEFERFERELSHASASFDPTPDFSLRMRRRLERHHSLLLSDPSRQPVSGMRRVFSFFSARVYATVSAFSIVLLTGGVSAFAYTSDSVTHGTPLYPIKRGLEAIEQVIRVSPVSEASFHVKILDRRLRESQYLTSQGIADDATNDDVSLAVNNGLQAVQTLSDTNNRDGLLEQMTQLLKRQEASLYQLAGMTPPSSTLIDSPAPAGESAVTSSSSAVPVSTPVSIPSIAPQSPFLETEQPIVMPPSRTVTLPPADTVSPAPAGEAQRGYGDADITPSGPGETLIRGVSRSPRVEVEVRPSTVEPVRRRPSVASPVFSSDTSSPDVSSPDLAPAPVGESAGSSSGSSSSSLSSPSESSIFDAVRKNSQRLRQIEIRILEVHRQR